MTPLICLATYQPGRVRSFQRPPHSAPIGMGSDRGNTFGTLILKAVFVTTAFSKVISSTINNIAVTIGRAAFRSTAFEATSATVILQSAAALH